MNCIIMHFEWVKDCRINKNIIEIILQNIIDKRDTDYLNYILKIRLGQFLAVLLAKFIKKDKLLISIILFIAGGGIAVSVNSFIIYYKWKGFLLGLALLFPHYIFYFLALKYYCSIDRKGLSISVNRNEKMGYIVKKIKIFIVVIIGILSEYYVNSIILKFFKNLFT